jgi:hypothetical protein
MPYAPRSKRHFDSKMMLLPYCSLCLIVERRLKEYYALFKSYRTGHVLAATWRTPPPGSRYPGPSSTLSLAISSLLLLLIVIRLIVVLSVFIYLSV